MAAVVWEVLKVVTACHAAGVCHGDIKPANFLLSRKLARPLHMVPAGARPDDGPWLIAIDFGCAQLAPPTKQLTRRTGTPVYMVSCCTLVAHEFMGVLVWHCMKAHDCSSTRFRPCVTRTSPCRGCKHADPTARPRRRRRFSSASTRGPRTCGASA